MISKNIKTLRIQKGLTQKDLADQLHVTPQAISRWEKGDVEPSLDTVSNMAKIFDVTIDEILGDTETLINNKLKNTSETESDANYEEDDEEYDEEYDDEDSDYEEDEDREDELVEKITEKVVARQPKPVLAVCEICNRPIYNGDEIVRNTHYHKSGRGGTTHTSTSVCCIQCEEKKKEEQLQSKINESKSCRIKSVIFGILVAIAVALLEIFVVPKFEPGIFDEPGFIIFAIIVPILAFAFVSCIFLNNNYLGEIFLSVASWGAVEFPGLIFSLDLDGISWFIVMKIAFWIIGFALGLLAIIFALVLCLTLSIFVYPIALLRSINHPKKTDEY